jgi:putative peptidoglycan lipid II flippase
MSMEQKDQNRRVLRSTFVMASPTFLSRVLGLFRDILQAKFMGTSGSMDAFTMGNLIPNLLRRLTAEGAMTAAFIPVFTQTKKEKSREELWKFANAFFYDLTIIMAVLMVLGMVFSPLLVRIIAPGYGEVPGKWELTAVLTRIMFPYIFLISLAALAMAILNSFHKFFVPAFTPVLFNLSIIIAALFFAQKAEEPAFVFAVGVVIGGVLQLAIQIPFLWRNGMRFRFGLSFAHPAVRKVGKLMIPGLFGAGVIQINYAISRILASKLEEGSVSSLYFGSRVQELTLGLFAIGLSIALLPTFSEQALLKDISGMKRTLAFSFKFIFFITFPAMVGLLVLNRPIIQVLLERGLFGAQSTDMTSQCLFYFAFGLPFISGVKILSPAFYSFKDIKTPVIVSFFVMIAYIGLSLLLMSPLRVGGIALALSVSSVFNFIALFFLLERKIGRIEKKGFVISGIKYGFSAGLMGIAVWFFMKQFDFSRLVFLKQLGILCAAVALGILVYVVLSLLFSHEDVKSLKDVLAREKITTEIREKR